MALIYKFKESNIASAEIDSFTKRILESHFTNSDFSIKYKGHCIDYEHFNRSYGLCAENLKKMVSEIIQVLKLTVDSLRPFNNLSEDIIKETLVNAIKRYDETFNHKYQFSFSDKTLFFEYSFSKNKITIAVNASEIVNDAIKLLPIIRKEIESDGSDESLEELLDSIIPDSR